MVNDFIFELGCEELPSGLVWPLADELVNHVIAALDHAQLSHGEVACFATPRRLAVVIYDLAAQQKPQSVTRRGPSVAAAYDQQGQPTPALLGFAKSCGVPVDQLEQLATDKGDWLVHTSNSLGEETVHLLPELIKKSLAALTIPKPMRWGSGLHEFSRPVHWAVMLYGPDLIATEVLGVKTGRLSRGHRFHHPQELVITAAQDYEQQMQAAFVVADFAKRRQMIIDQVTLLAETLKATAVMPEALIDEVTSIVEWPQALMAHFSEEFLAVPAEALIAAMQSHQKCFALRDHEGKLLPHFITVANIASVDAHQVILGNEKVMRARLSDAAFFFSQDKKSDLSQYIPMTQQVVFQVKLGTLFDKTQRIKSLMNDLAHPFALDKSQAERAAILSKCDLLSGMVGEFPELQGLMGYYYALHDGESPAVAQALNEQYMPRFAADHLPKSSLGSALSLADRIDTLVGIFALGQKPSGVKDPFKLRRHALAVVRLLSSLPVTLNISWLIDQAAAHYSDRLVIDKTVLNDLKLFILERLPAYYQSQGISPDLVHAVRARQDDCFYDLDQRLNALKLFVNLPAAASLSAACKRVNNLLSQLPKSDVEPIVNETLLEEGAERALFEQMQRMSEVIEPLYQQADYGEVLAQLARISEPVDAFFEQVMVMVDDPEVKKNRLALLTRLQGMLQGVADISLLQMP